MSRQVFPNLKLSANWCPILDGDVSATIHNCAGKIFMVYQKGQKAPKWSVKYRTSLRLRPFEQMHMVICAFI